MIHRACKLAKLGIPSVNTVYAHLDHCRGRLGTNTPEEAVKHAVEMGYI